MGRACSTHEIEYECVQRVGGKLRNERPQCRHRLDWKLIFVRTSGRWDGGMD
jgi:hypothetical protein